MPQTTNAATYELRRYERSRVPPFSGITVQFGPLGARPTEGTPINISRGGVLARTSVAMLEGSRDHECLVRFYDPRARLAPETTLGQVRRVEETGGYFLVAIEFSLPLSDVDF